MAHVAYELAWLSHPIGYENQTGTTLSRDHLNSGEMGLRLPVQNLCLSAFQIDGKTNGRVA